MALAIVTIASLAAVVGVSVGVIMLNNLVMQRTVELERLDQERRELRTENALLSSQIAKLSAPPRIVRRARTRLGMATPQEMTRFIYLDPANRPPRKARPHTQKAQTRGTRTQG